MPAVAESILLVIALPPPPPPLFHCFSAGRRPLKTRRGETWKERERRARRRDGRKDDGCGGYLARRRHLLGGGGGVRLACRMSAVCLRPPVGRATLLAALSRAISTTLRFLPALIAELIVFCILHSVTLRLYSRLAAWRSG